MFVCPGYENLQFSTVQYNITYLLLFQTHIGGYIPS